MEYKVVKGFQGGDLYYLPSDKHLYVRKSDRLGHVYLVCNDTIVSKQKKFANNEFELCSARCCVDENANMCRKTQDIHTKHGDHEIIYKDMVSRNAMKDRCRFIAENFPMSANKIPIKEIFLMEMSK